MSSLLLSKPWSVTLHKVLARKEVYSFEETLGEGGKRGFLHSH